MVSKPAIVESSNPDTTDPDQSVVPSHLTPDQASSSDVQVSPPDTKGTDQEIPHDSNGNGKYSDSSDFIDLGVEDNNLFALLNGLPSWLLSGLLHIVFMLAFALTYLPLPPTTSLTEILISQREATEELEEMVIEETEPVPIETTQSNVMSELLTETVNLTNEITSITEADDVDAAAPSVDLTEISEFTDSKSDLLAAVGTSGGAGLSGRSGTEKARLVRDMGGTKASEAAVARALGWFSKHQFNDGGWNFNFQASRCQGRCQNHGTMQARVGATAMALLPFLGAGQTHLKGKYQQQVRGGLYFLIHSIKLKEGNIGELWEPEGKMYSHCLATIALCEAYGMTKDQDLAAAAQTAVNYVAFAQIPNDGGWRYTSNDSRGDTSVVGWALMALKSAHMAYLHVDSNTYRGASMFLDSVQSDGGAGYGYTQRQTTPPTAAIGLLCRMYLGWDQTHKPLQVGVETLSKLGPSRENMYYNYYATQVMRHYGGDFWTKWNEVMREYLIEKQAKEGHENGSWHFGGGHGSAAGRLYATSMATMILEVYYRHLPIYRIQATEDDFPL